MADDEVPAPVRSWSQMSEAERERVRRETKPPPRERALAPTPDPSAPPRWQRPRVDDPQPVEVVAVKRIRETAKARLYLFQDGREVWLPAFAIVSTDVMDDNTEILEVMPRIAREKGLAP